MADLIPTPPLAHEPLVLANTTLSVDATRRITSVAPFKGQHAAVATALEQAIGLGLPRTGESLRKGDASVIWSGYDQYFVLGTELDVTSLAGLAAVTDQSDGWVSLRLEGPEGEDALARLVPLDLRRAAFPDQQAARSQLNHMMTLIVRDAGGFSIFVMRSFAQTAWHELSAALRSVVARRAVEFSDPTA